MQMSEQSGETECWSSQSMAIFRADFKDVRDIGH